MRYLLERYVRGQLTEQERLELEKLFQDTDYENIIKEELVRLLGEETGASDIGTGAWGPVLQRILSVDKTAGNTGATVRPMWYYRLRWSAAAIFLLVTGGLFFFYRNNNVKREKSAPALAVTAIHPGCNRAVLTLANGQHIVLDNARKGMVSQQGNTRVMKVDSGVLAYAAAAGDAEENAAGNGMLYNTITTPRGGQYQVTLPDGTKVWLNAESSLRFPIAFKGSNREVQLTGEAYFEAAEDKSKPFIVRARETETRVLGTHFNIMSYADEGAVRTTLLEGKVSMASGQKQAVLQPGQQGQYDSDKGVIATRMVNTRAVVAWKDGYYYFDRTPVQAVMRQIARWYDVEIVYSGAVPRDEIVGKIPRTADVSEVLHVMELIGIHFKINGKQIIVI